MTLVSSAVNTVIVCYAEAPGEFVINLLNHFIDCLLTPFAFILEYFYIDICYPAEFQRNHPKLSDDMRMAWRQAWPTEFTY